MSLICVGSVKGAPGATTIACLLGASWPDPSRPIIGECDPCGGDLAARFSLSARTGWLSLVASVRRDGTPSTLTVHLQTLPGGLRVLVGDRETAVSGSSLAPLFVADGARFSDGPWDLIADLGRVAANATSAPQWPWLEAADGILVCLPSDTASTLHVKEWLELQPDVARAKTWLVVVDPASGRPTDELERFVGAPVVARLPRDDLVARALRGEPAPAGRFRRSALIRAAATLAAQVWSMTSEGTPTSGLTAGNGRSGISVVAGDAGPHDATPPLPIERATENINGIVRRRR